MKQFIQDLAETHRYQATHLLHILRGGTITLSLHSGSKR